MRFLREIESLRRLNHPGITSFIDSGESAGRPYLAMEAIGGLDLRLFTAKYSNGQVRNDMLGVDRSVVHFGCVGTHPPCGNGSSRCEAEQCVYGR